MSEVVACLGSDLPLGLLIDDMEFNAKKTAVRFLVGKGFFKGENIFGGEHEGKIFR